MAAPTFDDDESAKHLLVPPAPEQVPGEIVAMRLGARERARRLGEIELQLANIPVQIDDAIERVATRLALTVAKWAAGIIVTGIAGVFALVWFMATHFAAIDSNTQRLERLERLEHDHPIARSGT